MKHESRLIRVLLADASRHGLELLQRLIDRAPDMLVVGTADTVREAVAMAQRLRPDLVVMDASIPDANGIHATRQIMAKQSTTIAVIATEPLSHASGRMLTALSADAVDVLCRPSHDSLTCDGEGAQAFLQKLRIIVRVGVLGIIRHTHADLRVVYSPSSDTPLSASPPRGFEAPHILALGAATGGQPCILTILAQLDPATAPPVLLVQHMNAHFVEAFVAWLDAAVDLRVRLAQDGETIEPCVVHVAPGDCQLTIDAQHRIRLRDDPPVNGHRPAVDPLFHSLAQVAARASVGVLLTGMGSDGALGLAAMRAAGCLTFAQDERSSVVYGMPKAAAGLGAPLIVANPLHIGRLLRQPHVALMRGAIDGPCLSLRALTPEAKR